MQTATSETESKSLDLSICVHHYTLRAPCPKGQGKKTHAAARRPAFCHRLPEPAPVPRHRHGRRSGAPPATAPFPTERPPASPCVRFDGAVPSPRAAAPRAAAARPRRSRPPPPAAVVRRAPLPRRRWGGGAVAPPPGRWRRRWPRRSWRRRRTSCGRPRALGRPAAVKCHGGGRRPPRDHWHHSQWHGAARGRGGRERRPQSGRAGARATRAATHVGHRCEGHPRPARRPRQRPGRRGGTWQPRNGRRPRGGSGPRPSQQFSTIARTLWPRPTPTAAVVGAPLCPWQRAASAYLPLLLFPRAHRVSTGRSSLVRASACCPRPRRAPPSWKSCRACTCNQTKRNIWSGTSLRNKSSWPCLSSRSS